MAAGTLLSAINVTAWRSSDQRIRFGRRLAGCDIASLLEADGEAGLPRRRAGRFFMVDRDGLLVDGIDEIAPFGGPCSPEAMASWLWGDRQVSLLDVIRNARPTAPIGVSGQPSSFMESAVRAMARANRRPVIFPLSNPTSRHEATHRRHRAWSEGRAIIGAGSPFPPAAPTETVSEYMIRPDDQHLRFPGHRVGRG